VVSALLDLGADIIRRDVNGATPLHLADVVSWSVVQKTVVELLVENGLELHSRDSEDQTPLHHAASFGRVQAVATLLRHGADVNAMDSTGMTPLHCVMEGKAADWDKEEEFIGTMKRLLRAGADIHVVNQSGQTPLELGLASGNTDRADILCNHGKVPVILPPEQPSVPPLSPR
jgi:ankyrin repeat protein